MTATRLPLVRAPVRAQVRAPVRVLITGIGLVTPAGPDRESSWRALRDGQSATRWLSSDAFSRLIPGSPFPAPVPRFVGAPAAPQPGHPERDSRPGAPDDPVVALALRAAHEACADAGLVFPLASPHRAGCVLGTSKGGFRTFTAAWAGRHVDRHGTTDAGAMGVDRIGSDDWWNQFEPAAAARRLAARHGLQGAALCPVAACATGLVSIARGAELIERGRCDLVLAGSSDASLHPAILGSFRRLGVLARDFEDPAAACRPFDRRRDGFVVGEGAAVVVLEGAEHALARGATPYAQWLAAGSAADPVHLTQLDADPASLIRLIESVLRRAGVAPDEIDYVNLHGTATGPNDVCESRALQAALGAHARVVSTSSLKGTIGHLLGGAGSVELAATLLALRDGVVPPTANLREADPRCPLDYTPIVPRHKPIETALKLSLGFGGHLAAAVIRAWPGGRTGSNE